jgi:dephospho-CoA kinase
MPYRIGLTGSMASGKSFLAQQFARLGANIINADQICRQLTETNKAIITQIIAHFGPKAALSNGTLNRPYLSQRIFNHSNDKAWLEACLHPHVRTQIIQRTQDTNSAPYHLIEIPLLFESQEQYDFLNRILVVESTREEQIERALARQQMNQETIERALKQQASEQQRRCIANDVILNRKASINKVYQQIQTLHLFYLAKAKSA